LANVNFENYLINIKDDDGAIRANSISKRFRKNYKILKIFIIVFEEIGGIVIHGDFHKIPVS
jgi:hypothetical protein